MLRHTWDQNFVSGTWPHKPNRFVAFVRKSLPPNTSSTGLPVMPPDLQLLCQQHLGTLRECLQLVSEWARERVVLARQTTAFFESSETGAGPPLTSSLHFLQRSENAHPTDAGSTLTRLVHGQERVDSLVHENRPIADSSFGRHSSLGSCDHDRPTWEKCRKRWDKIFFSQCQKP